MIIDISTGRPKVFGEPTDTKDAEAKNVTPEQRVTQYRDHWQACRHFRMEFDDKQRTIQCRDCRMWLDPFWAFKELWRYYDQRIDQRLEAIKEYEQREKERRERADKRKREPRQTRIARRAETAERAAYNEYQAKVLTARAERQRALVARLDEEIRSEEAQSVGAVDPHVGVSNV